MPTSARGKTYTLDCPNGRLNLRYFAVAASVGLPKSLLLGRLIVRAVKPTDRQLRSYDAFLERRAPSRGSRRPTARKGGKRK